MFLKALKFTSGLAGAMVCGAVDGAEEDAQAELEEFSDGQDSFSVNGSSMTQEVAETRKDFGELHAKHFR